MSAGSLGKRWPGAIQDDEHVQAVLRTLAQFVERDTVYCVTQSSACSMQRYWSPADETVSSWDSR